MLIIGNLERFFMMKNGAKEKNVEQKIDLVVLNTIRHDR